MLVQFTAEYLQKFVEAGCAPKHRLASFMVTHDARLPPGTRLYAKHFRVGDHVDVTGRTYARIAFLIEHSHCAALIGASKALCIDGACVE